MYCFPFSRPQLNCEHSLQVPRTLFLCHIYSTHHDPRNFTDPNAGSPPRTTSLSRPQTQPLGASTRRRLCTTRSTSLTRPRSRP